MLTLNEDKIAKIAQTELIVIDYSTNSIINFFGSRKIWKVLDKKNDTLELEMILIETLKYIASIHKRYMFHGDIKPANIFYTSYSKDLRISSDSGSLI